MSLPRPNESYHFQANLIWWDSPFKDLKSRLLCFRGQHCERQDFVGIEESVSMWEQDTILLVHPIGGESLITLVYLAYAAVVLFSPYFSV